MDIVAIVGSRDWTHREVIRRYINNMPSDTVIVTGGARGVDQIAEELAEEAGLTVIVFEPDWDRFGKRAGLIRNSQIVAASNVLVAFWDGKSRGTRDSINKALEAKNIQKVLVIKGPYDVW